MTATSEQAPGTPANAKRLLWAGFMAILAAGAGFALRGGIFDNWGREYGFTSGQLGSIGGAGLSGFCFGIMIGGVLADRLGYGVLVVAAFLLHVLSALVTFAAGGDSAYLMLVAGMFLFALANGTLEAVANPLVATLFPHNRTHYLNILHASWPLGLIFGGIVGWILDDQLQVHWKIQLALYLVPTVAYGFMFLGQRMPRSEASAKGLSLAEMFKDVGLLGGAVAAFLLSLFFSWALVLTGALDEGTARWVGYGIGAALLVVVGRLTGFALGSPLLFVLFLVHALVGAVELGTDGWIQNITGNILSSEQGKFLFVFTSLVMFGLRFSAHFIEKKLKLSPVGILLVCAILASVGLNLTSGVTSFGTAVLALLVYAIGKTFFWPTMLAVASDRFPRTGAVAISIMGGIGMMSAGLIGSPGLGYAKDRFAGRALAEQDAALFAEYKAESPSRFLFFGEVHGLDGRKLGSVQEKLEAARRELAAAGNTDPLAALERLGPAERAVHEASITGDRRTLVADSFIPAIMALVYLGLFVYFRGIGGYRPVRIGED